MYTYSNLFYMLVKILVLEYIRILNLGSHACFIIDIKRYFFKILHFY